MVEIAFYQLQKISLYKALAKLLERTLEGGDRALVLVNSKTHLDALNEELWDYADGAWLPHGSITGFCPERQPVLLSTSLELVNGANFLFLTNGVNTKRVNEFDRCFDLFDGGDASQIELARSRWSSHKKKGQSLTYWQETKSGGWEKINY